MPWARASQLDRFLECSAASWLPRWDDVRGVESRGYLRGSAVNVLVNPTLAVVKKDTRARDIGNEAHELVEAGRHAELWKGLDPRGNHEVAVSYCCKTSKVRMWAGLDKRRRD